MSGGFIPDDPTTWRDFRDPSAHGLVKPDCHTTLENAFRNLAIAFAMAAVIVWLQQYGRPTPERVWAQAHVVPLVPVLAGSRWSLCSRWPCGGSRISSIWSIRRGTPSTTKVIGVNNVFKEAALEFVRQWKYTPTLLHFVPTEVALRDGGVSDHEVRDFGLGSAPAWHPIARARRPQGHPA